MKSTLLFSTLFLGIFTFAAETDSTGLEGDHLDLSAVLAIFQDSESPEDFEKKLNTESSNVNNLDLNGDGEVDYIRVVDSGDSTAHVLTLQVPVNENESQDIATIELEQTDVDVVELQIVGDEELYGENYVLLPESAGHGPVVINVIAWRPVRFMWGPRYRLWVSPWRYRAYPGWYRPWKRRSWGVYRRHVVVYRGGCRRVYRRSFSHAHVHFYRRTSSVSFHKTHHHKHSGKSAGSNNTGGKTVKSSTKSQEKASNKPVTKTSTPATSTKQGTVKTKSTENSSKGTKAAAKPNTQKVTTTNSNTSAPKKKATTQQQPSKNKSASPNSSRSPGAKNSKARKRPGTSSGRKGGNAGRKSGGKRK